MQVFQQLFFYKNVNFYSNRTLSNPSVFYEAIQHFFDGFPKSVGRLRCKEKYWGVFWSAEKGKL